MCCCAPIDMQAMHASHSHPTYTHRLPQLTQATGNILGVTPVQYVSWNSAAARALSLPLLLATAMLAVAAARWLL